MLLIRRQRNEWCRIESLPGYCDDIVTILAYFHFKALMKKWGTRYFRHLGLSEQRFQTCGTMALQECVHLDAV